MFYGKYLHYSTLLNKFTYDTGCTVARIKICIYVSKL